MLLPVPEIVPEIVSPVLQYVVETVGKVRHEINNHYI
jgi:hypothetical protein